MRAPHGASGSIAWALDVLLASPGLIRVALVVSIERFAHGLPAAADDRCLLVPGGDARADSVIAALWALTGAATTTRRSCSCTTRHDPAGSIELIGAIAKAAAEGAGRAVVPVVPIVPIVDSLKRVRGERVVAPVEREELAAARRTGTVADDTDRLNRATAATRSLAATSANRNRAGFSVPAWHLQCF